jgi:CRISPR/Cas system-associated protein endoribonuclease Cas2
MWNKSDLYHISLIFSHRQHLSDKFRSFLQDDGLPVYMSSMYATKLESDSAANYENIEKLLHIYFDGQKVECVQCCIKQATYYDGKGVFLERLVRFDIMNKKTSIKII